MRLERVGRLCVAVWIAISMVAPAASLAAAGVLAPRTVKTEEAPRTLSYGPFGDVSVYRPHGTPTSVALFVSGDGGWTSGVVAMARHLVDGGAVVVGIDMRRYRVALDQVGDGCRYLGGDFEGLSHYAQLELGLESYIVPVLVGYSSGASLVYAVAMQSLKGTYAAALTLGFCPDIDVTQPLCKMGGLVYDAKPAEVGVSAPIRGMVFRPAPTNTTPWVTLQGSRDEVCPMDRTREFVTATVGGALVALPEVGHGFSVEHHWLPQFLAAYRRLATAPVHADMLPEVDDLPLVEVQARGEPLPEERNVYAVLLTGDGGWSGLDQDVAAAFAARGIPVVALNTLKYFWKKRDPERAARDLDRIVRQYRARWNRTEVLLIGYSFGADVLPFLYTRLPEETRNTVKSVNLLGLAHTATFEFSLSDWIPGPHDGVPTAPEVVRMHANVLCLYGSDERDSPCPGLQRPGVTAIAMHGGHHFDGNYAALVEQMAAFAQHAGG